MSVATVRILLGDIARFERQTATGDGATKQFTLTKYPVVTSSETVTVDGSASTYTLDVETGLLAFSTAPGVGDVVAMTYEYAEISDESITALLALTSGDVYETAALAADSIAGRYAGLVDKKIGDLSMSWSQRAKQWHDKAASIRKSGRSALFAPFAGGISQASKDVYAADTDVVQPAFTRTLHDNEGADADF